MLETAESAAALLRAARRSAGLTQQQLADRAGITQSVVSAYESGRREPALSTLRALVDATGHDLAVTLVASSAGRLTGALGQRVRQRRGRLVRAAARHGVSGLRLFGSVARGQEHPGSDVDLLVDLPVDAGLLTLFRVQADLERLLEAPVDLVPADSLRPDVARALAPDLVVL